MEFTNTVFLSAIYLLPLLGVEAASPNRGGPVEIKTAPAAGNPTPAATPTPTPAACPTKSESKLKRFKPSHHAKIKREELILRSANIPEGNFTISLQKRVEKRPPAHINYIPANAKTLYVAPGEIKAPPTEDIYLWTDKYDTGYCIAVVGFPKKKGTNNFRRFLINISGKIPNQESQANALDHATTAAKEDYKKELGGTPTDQEIMKGFKL